MTTATQRRWSASARSRPWSRRSRSRPLSIARKFQALAITHFPGLDFRGYRAGLTPAQVAALRLPSTPLKDTERRADRWCAAWGVEQTELDALAVLAPEEFQRLAQRAVAPFADLDLDRRVDAERARFLREAQAMVDAAIDPGERQRVRDDAQAALDRLRAAETAARRLVAADVIHELGDFLPPDPELTESGGLPPVIDSKWSFVEQTQRLRASKKYT